MMPGVFVVHTYAYRYGWMKNRPAAGAWTARIPVRLPNAPETACPGRLSWEKVGMSRLPGASLKDYAKSVTGTTSY
jgi:hypothetical protein